MDVENKPVPPGEMFNYEDESQRWVFIGPTRCGKTWSLCHALLNWVPPHDEYYIVCPTWEAQPIYYYMQEQLGAQLFDDYDEHLIESLIYRQKMRTKWNVNKRICLILDDVLSCRGVKGKDSTGILERVYALGRHHKLSCFTLLQKITAVSTTVRTNASFAMFRCDSDYEMRTLYATCGFGDIFVFRRELAKIWLTPRLPFLYRVTDHRFYHGWSLEMVCNLPGVEAPPESPKYTATSNSAADAQRQDSTIEERSSDAENATALPQSAPIPSASAAAVEEETLSSPLPAAPSEALAEPAPP